MYYDTYKKNRRKNRTQDVEVQADPCKWYYDKHGIISQIDCMVDCAGSTPKGTVAY
ncbi:hypothetical protein [Clostridioides difficile]|uniref:hypothetical protein n=1 Tax=Clostridioides difficile TaxID=1496 RepID=UPI00038D752F|nr:hypothetical protein [Clostridioides difficile]EQK22268.1 hypothetical protein QUU_0476 [Clostridioides difficile P70]